MDALTRDYVSYTKFLVLIYGVPSTEGFIWKIVWFMARLPFTLMFVIVVESLGKLFSESKTFWND